MIRMADSKNLIFISYCRRLAGGIILMNNCTWKLQVFSMNCAENIISEQYLAINFELPTHDWKRYPIECSVAILPCCTVSIYIRKI